MIEIIGGPDRDRTDDLFHAMEARSQLRHRPTPIYSRLAVGFASNAFLLRGLGGLRLRFINSAVGGTFMGGCGV